MTTSLESRQQWPEDLTANVPELALLWLRIAVLEGLAITERLPVRPVVLSALEDYLMYLPAVPMTTVLQSTLRRMPCCTATGRIWSGQPSTSHGNPATPATS